MTYSDIVKETVETPITIENLLKQQNEVFNETADIRNKIIEKVFTAIDKMTLDLEEQDIDTVTKKNMMVNTLSTLLNDKEKSFNTRITSLMKNKELNSNAEQGRLAVEILNKINLSNIGRRDIDGISESNPIRNEDLNELNALKNSEDFTIMDSEIKTDPKDYE